jgi:hypothetical protein
MGRRRGRLRCRWRLSRLEFLIRIWGFSRGFECYVVSWACDLFVCLGEYLNTLLISRFFFPQHTLSVLFLKKKKNRLNMSCLSRALSKNLSTYHSMLSDLFLSHQSKTAEILHCHPYV